MREHYTDQGLVTMIRSGDTKAEGRAVRFLVSRNREKAIKYVCANSGRREEGEELFNDAVTALWSNIRSGSYRLSESAAMETYLMAIVKNLWRKQLRKLNRLAVTSAESYEGESSDTARSVEQLMIEKDKNDHFRRIFENCLNEKEKRILRSFYIDRMSMQEVADEFGLGNANNAKSHKYQIVKKLKKCLDDHEFWI